MKRFREISLIIICSFLATLIPKTFYAQLSWQQTNSMEGFPIYEFLSVDETLYAATYGAGIHKTEDEGKTWTLCNEGLTNLFVRSLIQKEATLFAGTKQGVFKSDDEGKTWHPANDTIISTDIWSLATHGNLLLAGTSTTPKSGTNSGKGDGVYISNNEGRSWIKAELPNTNAHHQTIYCFGSKGKKILAGSTKYLYQSEDNGQTWKATKVPTYLSVTDIHLYNDLILLGTSGEGILASREGEKWTTYGENKGNIRSLINADNALVVGVSLDGIKRESEFINGGLTNPAIKSLIFHEGKLYAGTFKKGVWRYDVPQENFLPPQTNSRQTQRGVTIYPNPIEDGLLIIDYELIEAANVSIQLYDSFGKQLSHITKATQQAKGLHQSKYDMSGLSAGTYYLHLQLGDRSISKPIIMIQ